MRGGFATSILQRIPPLGGSMGFERVCPLVRGRRTSRRRRGSDWRRWKRQIPAVPHLLGSGWARAARDSRSGRRRLA